jgi:hypothetical protein
VLERVVVLAPSALHERARALLARVEQRTRDGGEFVDLATGEPASDGGHYLKGGPLRGSSARRHGFARLWLRRAPPRLREYANLRALRACGIAAPEPILAAARVRGPRVLSQLLLTERVADAGSYQALVESPASPLRALALRELARTLARLHALGFAHRDLFLRNLLHTRAHGRFEPVVLDLWRGGRVPGPWRALAVRRGARAARDLGLLCTDLARHTQPSEVAQFLADYLARRAELSAPLAAPAFVRRIQAAYASECRREAREPHRRRGRAALDPDWRVPAPLDGP